MTEQENPWFEEKEGKQEDLKPDGHLCIKFFNDTQIQFTFREVAAHLYDVINCTYVVRFNKDVGQQHDYASFPLMNIMAIFVKTNSDDYVTQERGKELSRQIEESLKEMSEGDFDADES